MNPLPTLKPERMEELEDGASIWFSERLEGYVRFAERLRHAYCVRPPVSLSNSS